MRLGRNRARCRCIFLKRIMDSIRVIIRDVITHQTAQMKLVEDDYVIEKVSSAAFDPAFRNSILPRTRKACACGPHTAGREEIGYLLAKLGITIQNQVTVRTRFREKFPSVAARSRGRSDAP